MAKWGQRLALAGGALLFWPGFPSPYFAIKALALSGGLAAAWFAAPRARSTPLRAPLTVLLALCALAAYFSVDPYQSFWGDARQPAHGLLQLSLYALAYLFAAAADEPLLEDGLNALCWAGAAAGVLALAQAAGALEPRWAAINGRLIGPSGNPAFFGALAALLWPVCLARFKKGGAAAVGACLLPLALLLTWTRGAWLAAGAGALVWLAASGRARPKAWWGLAAAGALAALVFGGRAFGRGTSDSVRVELWSAAARAAVERPLGYGLDNYQPALRKLKTEKYLKALRSAKIEQSSAHNDVLQAAATLGVPGLLAYLWLLAAAGLMLKRALAEKNHERAAACAAGLAGVFVVAKFNPVTPETLFAAAWLAGAAAPRGEPLPSFRLVGFSVNACCVLALNLLVFFSDRATGEARRALTRGLVPAAVAAAERAAMLTPSRLHAELALAEALVAAGEGERALAAARLTARRHPGNPQAREVSGSTALYAGLKNNDPALLREALSELKEATRLDPYHPYSMQRRLQAASALKDSAEFDLAGAELTRAEAAVAAP